MSYKLESDGEVLELMDTYPELVRDKLLFLRELILEVASEVESVELLEETLKWGEPSYVTKHGSTVRIDWKEKKPDQYGMYFKCTSKLVPTFKAVFGDEFTYEGDRAIIFKMNDDVKVGDLRRCIATALEYHKVKELEFLGMK